MYKDHHTIPTGMQATCHWIVSLEGYLNGACDLVNMASRQVDRENIPGYQSQCQEQRNDAQIQTRTRHQATLFVLWCRRRVAASASTKAAANLKQQPPSPVCSPACRIVEGDHFVWLNRVFCRFIVCLLCDGSLFNSCNFFSHKVHLCDALGETEISCGTAFDFRTNFQAICFKFAKYWLGWFRHLRC